MTKRMDWDKATARDRARNPKPPVQYDGPYGSGRPATLKQIELMRKLAQELGEERPSGLTRGQASRWIKDAIQRGSR
jgi:hypothetical protein